MTERFAKHLDSLNGCSIRISDDGPRPEDEQGAVLIMFANGTKLRADYWRLIKKGKHILSSFDHLQRYGLPAPIDAKMELRGELSGEIVADARLDLETGDLLFRFEDRSLLQVLNFTGYEVWEMGFPDGLAEYSNYNK